MTKAEIDAKRKRQYAQYKTIAPEPKKKEPRKVRYGSMVDKVQGTYKHNGIQRGR